MPYLSITTNALLAPETESALTAASSKILATELGKPEAYVMVSVQPAPALRFGGTDDPAAFLDLRSIGLPKNLNPLASALTALLGEHGQVPAGRVFITFADLPPARWAHGGSTFA